MQFLRNERDKIILGVDPNKLYFLTKEIDENPLIQEAEVVNLMINDETQSIEIELIEMGQGRLLTILEQQMEFNLHDSVKSMMVKLRAVSPRWGLIVEGLTEQLSVLNQRVKIFEVEGSGRTSGWRDRLYLIPGAKTFRLSRCRYINFSASEIVEIYGLEDNEFWDTRLINGEFIEFDVAGIETVRELRDSIVMALVDEEQANIHESEIPWSGIASTMIKEPRCAKLGRELRRVLDVK